MKIIDVITESSFMMSPTTDDLTKSDPRYWDEIVLEIEGSVGSSSSDMSMYLGKRGEDGKDDTEITVDVTAEYRYNRGEPETRSDPGEDSYLEIQWDVNTDGMGLPDNMVAVIESADNYAAVYDEMLEAAHPDHNF